MGYRNYFGYIPKKEYNKIKSKSLNELTELTIQKLIDKGETEIDLEYVKHDIEYELITPHIVELHELGKYVNLGETPKGSVKKFFTKKESDDIVNNDDTELHVVTPEFFVHVINHYREKIKAYYEDMIPNREKLSEIYQKIGDDYDDKYETVHYQKSEHDFTNEEITMLIKSIKHVWSMSIEWLQLNPINLDLDKPEITNSWKFEYNIFELTRIYKSFDWKRNVLVYYGG